ncbi:MAG TPA: molybdopterin-dependent oxidoreductase [Acidimicrobiia bacterium]|nr:molybdopterin-dependent oxidoreductase [Acidimicrobiia bacterium]
MKAPPVQPRRRDAALAGGVAAMFALGVSELLTGLIPSVPSLIVSIGTGIIDLAPPAVKDLAIETFGTADKPALLVGIVVLSALFGALLGLGGIRSMAIPSVGFLVFGALGAIAAIQDPQSQALPSIMVAAVAAGAGLAAFLAMIRRAGVGEMPVVEADLARRAFLRGAGAFALLAGVTAVAGRLLVDRVRMASNRAEVVLPSAQTPLPAPAPGSSLSVAGIAPVVTPNDAFYRIDTALSVPSVDLDTWSLKITGMVDRPYELTYDDLLDLPMVERYVTLSCVSNQVGGDLVGNAKWLGVPLTDVLDRAGVQQGADQIVGRSLDGFTIGFPTEVAFDGREALVAVGMNDEPLPFDHGFPARLVVAGLYGYVSATKWLADIELTTWDAFDAYWVPKGWAKEGPIKTQSRIDTPQANARLGAGTRPIAGVAWAPGRGISRVEVQVDEGGWQEGTLSEPLSKESWRQWSLNWEAGSGTHTVQVRATDGNGDTQTTMPRPPRPDGATGYHTISVVVE